MPLADQAQPFDDPNWVYEIKHDGFRALALIEGGHCWFVSRRKHKFHGFRNLTAALVREVHADMAVLDGELAVPDQRGRTVFSSMKKNRQQARYYAFDLLWLNGTDLRGRPLLERKHNLKLILPSRSLHVVYVDHTVGSGMTLYDLACQLDLEGIVAKKADSPYWAEGGNLPWVKIGNPNYSRKDRRTQVLDKAG